MFTTTPEYNNTIMDVGQRRFRSMVEIYFTESYKETYYDKDILRISMLEENENLDSLNIGSVIGKSLDLEIYDLEQNYNPRNPDSTIAPFLRPNRTVIPYIGLEDKRNVIQNHNFANGLDKWAVRSGAKATPIADGLRLEFINTTGNAGLGYEGANKNQLAGKYVTYGFKIRKVSGSSASYGITLTLSGVNDRDENVWMKASITASAFNSASAGAILSDTRTSKFKSVTSIYIETRPETSMVVDILDVEVTIDDFVEWIPLGIFYTDVFSITEQDLVVKISAMSVLPLLETVPYTFSPNLLSAFQGNKKITAKELAEDVILIGGFMNYFLPDYLNEYEFTILPEFEENVNCREVLIFLSQLTMSVVQDDREGLIYFDKIKKKVINQTITSSPEAYNSRLNQVSKTGDTEFKYPVLDDGLWTLDTGNWRLPDDKSKIGFRSTYMGDSTGTYATEPTIKITFADAFNVDSIRVAGDLARDEYPADFRLLFRNFYEEVMFTNTYVNNTKLDFVTEQLAYSNIYSVELYVDKWNVPNTNAKITFMGLNEFVYQLNADVYYRLTNQSNIETIVTKVEIKSADEQIGSYTNQIVFSTEGLYLLKIKDNPLILNQTLAEKLARDILAYYTFNKLVQEVEWVGNPALTLSDNLETIDRFKNTSTVNIVSNRIEYSGALRMTTIGMEEGYGDIEGQNRLEARRLSKHSGLQQDRREYPNTK